MSGVSLDFTGIDAAASKPFTKPGTIAVFKISDVKFEASKKASTPMMRVTFDRQEDAFSHNFMLQGKDADKTKKVLSRIQSLFIAALGEGGKLTGKITEESIKAKLLKKEVALKVTGEVSDQGKGFATLGFGGFCAPVGEINFLSFTKDEQAKIDEALEAIASSRSGGADSEGGSSGSYNEGGQESYGNTSEEFADAPKSSENF